MRVSNAAQSSSISRASICFIKISRARFRARTRSSPLPRPSSSRASVCRKSPAVDAHRAAPFCIRSTSEAHVFAFASGSITSKIVCVSSTARRHRNHTFSGTCRSTRGAISLKSTAIIPNPPPWISKSVARIACAISRHRTHSSRSSRTPPCFGRLRIERISRIHQRACFRRRSPRQRRHQQTRLPRAHRPENFRQSSARQPARQRIHRRHTRRRSLHCAPVAILKRRRHAPGQRRLHLQSQCRRRFHAHKMLPPPLFRRALFDVLSAIRQVEEGTYIRFLFA